MCNRTLYKKSVLKLITGNYPRQDLLSIQTFDGKKYICKTCHLKVIKGRLPCQAVVNNLYVDDIPTELESLKKLEQILIAKRIVFEKIAVMPKGQQRKIKGAICNVPVECDQTCSILPRPTERSGIILLKLKLEFRGHVYFEAVRPEFILAALNWLKANNVLYKDIKIDCRSVSRDLTELALENEVNSSSMPHSSLANNFDYTSKNLVESPNSDSPIENLEENNVNASNVNKELLNEEEKDNPLNADRSSANETCLQSVIPDFPLNVHFPARINVNKKKPDFTHLAFYS